MAIRATDNSQHALGEAAGRAVANSLEEVDESTVTRIGEAGRPRATSRISLASVPSFRCCPRASARWTKRPRKDVPNR